MNKAHDKKQTYPELRTPSGGDTVSPRQPDAPPQRIPPSKIMGELSKKHARNDIATWVGRSSPSVKSSPQRPVAQHQSHLRIGQGLATTLKATRGAPTEPLFFSPPALRSQSLGQMTQKNVAFASLRLADQPINQYFLMKYRGSKQLAKILLIRCGTT